MGASDGRLEDRGVRRMAWLSHGARRPTPARNVRAGVPCLAKPRHASPRQALPRSMPCRTLGHDGREACRHFPPGDGATTPTAPGMAAWFAGTAPLRPRGVEPRKHYSTRDRPPPASADGGPLPCRTLPCHALPCLEPCQASPRLATPSPALARVPDPCRTGIIAPGSPSLRSARTGRRAADGSRRARSGCPRSPPTGGC